MGNFGDVTNDAEETTVLLNPQRPEPVPVDNLGAFMRS
jgi:hypothetical protein